MAPLAAEAGDWNAIGYTISTLINMFWRTEDTMVSKWK
jgi:hypothetical protein